MYWPNVDIVASLLFLALMGVVPISYGLKKEIAVFGYLPEYRQSNFDYAGYFSKGLTHLIFFSLEVNPQSYFPDAMDRYSTTYLPHYHNHSHISPPLFVWKTS